MSAYYLSKNAEIIAKLKSEGYAERTLDDHRRCFDGLWKCHSLENTAFSMEAATDWLECRKPYWSYDTYKRYRRALYRFEKYLRCGEIDGEPHCGNNRFAYRDTDVSYINLPENYKALYREFYEAMTGERAKSTVDHYVAGCTDFLLFLSEQGCAKPDDMTIEQPVSYLRRIRVNAWTGETKSRYAEGVGCLLTYMSKRGYIPCCYSHVMSKLECETAVTSLRLSDLPCRGMSFQPSKAVEPCAEAFLASLEAHRYSVPPQQLFGFIFRNFFLFLEVNHMAYSIDAIQLWLGNIPKNASWELKRQMLARFAQYVETGSTERASNFVWKPLLVDALPEWSRNITEDYLTLRKKEGWEPSTLMMIRSSCARFFSFIGSKGICAPEAITPSLVKEFHDTDPHATPEAGNAYGTRIRKLLKYMADENLVPQSLHLAISTQCASRYEIVNIMDEDMIKAIYRYRENAVSPYELRHTAIVMLGLRMGIRASDIVNLKIGDFDWKRRAVSFVQKKTSKAVTLAVPTDAGNSVYKYIMHGRPASGASGAGFVFIRHTAPYSGLNRAVCNSSLDCILSANGMKLPHGQGFHITRRTFATRLLKARTKVDSIADALGHASRMSVGDYLAHDEEGMLLCPLQFSIGGA